MPLLQVGHIDPGVNHQARRKIGAPQGVRGQSGELPAKLVKFFTAHAQARGHVVAAEGAEQFRASAQRLDQGKAVDAASAAVSLPGFVKPHDDRGTVEFPAES